MCSIDANASTATRHIERGVMTSRVVADIEDAMRFIDRRQLVIEPWLDDPMPDYDCNPPLWQM